MNEGLARLEAMRARQKQAQHQALASVGAVTEDQYGHGALGAQPHEVLQPRLILE